MAIDNTKQRVTISVDAEVYESILKQKNNKDFNLSKILNTALIQYFECKEVNDIFKKHDKYIEDKLDKIIHKNTRQHTYMLNQIYRILLQSFFFTKAIILEKLDKADVIIEASKSLTDREIQSTKKEYKNVEDKDLTSNFSKMNPNYGEDDNEE